MGQMGKAFGIAGRFIGGQIRDYFIQKGVEKGAELVFDYFADGTEKTKEYPITEQQAKMLEGLPSCQFQWDDGHTETVKRVKISGKARVTVTVSRDPRKAALARKRR